MRGILHHRKRATPIRRLREPSQSGSKENWKQPSSFQIIYVNLPIVTLIYLNVGEVADNIRKDGPHRYGVRERACKIFTIPGRRPERGRRFLPFHLEQLVAAAWPR